jgi:radical SAM protein with 4Fe4S-binding SPASM domain
VRDLCAQLGVKKMSLLRFVPQTRGAQNVDELGMTVNDFSRMQYEIDMALEQSHPVQVRAGCPIDFRHAVGLRDGKARPCHAGDDLMLVRPDGSVHPCAAWKSLQVDSNVHDHDLGYIWNHSKVFQAIRMFKDAGYKTLAGVCMDCSALTTCMGGCPAQRLHAYGKTLEALYTSKSDPLCPCGAK